MATVGDGVVEQADHLCGRIHDDDDDYIFYSRIFTRYIKKYKIQQKNRNFLKIKSVPPVYGGVA